MHCPTVTEGQTEGSQSALRAETGQWGVGSIEVTKGVGILMKQTSAHWVGPCSIPLLRLSGKAKGHNWTAVLFRVSIGDNFYLPVKGWCLHGQTQRNGSLSPLQ